MATKGLSFNIPFEKPSRNRSQSKQSADDKSKVPSFDFLRKDEGKTSAGRASTGRPSAPLSSASPLNAAARGSSTARPDNNNNKWAQESQALRERIAADRNKSQKDPFDVKIAVGKRPDSLEELEERREAAAEALLAAERKSHSPRKSSALGDQESGSKSNLLPWVDPDIDSPKNVSSDHDDEDESGVNLDKKRKNQVHQHGNASGQSKIKVEHSDNDSSLDRFEKKRDGSPDVKPCPVGREKRQFMNTIKPLSRWEQNRQERLSRGVSEPSGYEGSEGYDNACPSNSSRVHFYQGDSGGRNPGFSRTSERHTSIPGSGRALEGYKKNILCGPRRSDTFNPEEDTYSDGEEDSFTRRSRGGPSSSPKYTSKHFDCVSTAERDLLLSLETEKAECAAQRRRYLALRTELEHQRDGFEMYRREEEAKLAQDREELDYIVEEQVQNLNKEAKSVGEEIKRTREALAAERRSNKNLKEDNEQMSDRLRDMQSDLLESQRKSRVEIDKMKKKITLLQKRITELESQIVEKDKNSALAERAEDCPDVTPRPATLSSSLLAASDKKQETKPVIAAERRRTSDPGKEVKPAVKVVQTVTRKSVSAAPEKVETRETCTKEINQSPASSAKTEDPKTTKSVTRRKSVSIASNSSAQEPPERVESVTGEITPFASGVIPTREQLLDDKEPIPQTDFPNDRVISERLTGAGKDRKELTYSNGKKEIVYSNGTRKVSVCVGEPNPQEGREKLHRVLYFSNGDVKHTFCTGKTMYWYNGAQTMHTQLPSGIELFDFRKTGQAERHFSNGVKEILYPEGVFKVIHADGTEDNLFPDNSKKHG